MTWSRSTKLLLFAGCLALVISFTGVMTGFGEGVIRSMDFDYYPGPCTTGPPPGSVTITFEGRTSGCTQASGTCIAGEEIVFTAVATGYTFQVCDRFIWNFGDGTTRETFGPNTSTRFGSPGPRTVSLQVSNQFGSVNAPTVTVGAPAPTSCGSAADRLCLIASRFRVSLRAEDPRTGRAGLGQAVPENDIFGYFSIPALTNDPSNLEVFVKIVDASAIGLGYWVFYGGLTDFEYTLTVFDTQTGLTEEYFKEGGTSQSGFDTQAFTGPHMPPPPAGACPGSVAGVASQGAAGTCTQGGNSLCLLSGRFRVALSARDALRTNNTGTGSASKESETLGWFSIPALTGNANNPEVFVKMLDATGFGAGYWVFYSGLTDLEFTLTVTNMQNGKVKTYVRPAVPAGQTPCGAFDTAAFTAQ